VELSEPLELSVVEERVVVEELMDVVLTEVVVVAVVTESVVSVVEVRVSVMVETVVVVVMEVTESVVSVVEVRVSVVLARRRPSTSPGVDASCTPPPQEQHASVAGGAAVPATRDAKVLLRAVQPGPCPPLDVQRRFRL
jgi:hypothetical protein